MLRCHKQLDPVHDIILTITDTRITSLTSCTCIMIDLDLKKFNTVNSSMIVGFK